MIVLEDLKLGDLIHWSTINHDDGLDPDELELHLIGKIVNVTDSNVGIWWIFDNDEYPGGGEGVNENNPQIFEFIDSSNQHWQILTNLIDEKKAFEIMLKKS